MSSDSLEQQSALTSSAATNNLQSSSTVTSSCGGINKSTNPNEQGQTKNRICRDFVRGRSCRRLYCKYPHVQSSELVIFCHDFQNTGKCPRINCKFLHYSIDEEEYYRKFGEFPQHQQQLQQQQHQDDFSSNQNLNNNNNGGGGEYTHDYEYEFFNNSNSNNRIPSLLDSDLFHHPCQQSLSTRMECSVHCHNSNNFGDNSRGFRNGLKRLNNQDRVDFLQQQQQSKFKRCREDELMTILRRFEEEHLMLKRRVEANELKIAELRASNEYLLTQNAQLRLSTVQVSRVVNPVTVTNTQSQQGTPAPQVINASMAPVQVATPIVSMAAPQTQLLTTPQTPIAIHAPAALSAISNANQNIISYPIMTHSILPH